MFDMGAKNVIEKILPIVDNFERGLKAIETVEELKLILNEKQKYSVILKEVLIKICFYVLWPNILPQIQKFMKNLNM